MIRGVPASLVFAFLEFDPVLACHPPLSHFRFSVLDDAPDAPATV